MMLMLYLYQGTWQMNDEIALTLGVRYANEKSALENAGGYTELFANFAGTIFASS